MNWLQARPGVHFTFELTEQRKNLKLGERYASLF